MKPPTITLNDDGATAWLGDKPYFNIRWAKLETISIEVEAVPEMGYTEAFWKLSGDESDFVAPVEIIAGAEEFNTRLFALPNFDFEAYERARRAEADLQQGKFVCWQRK